MTHGVPFPPPLFFLEDSQRHAGWNWFGVQLPTDGGINAFWLPGRRPLLKENTFGFKKRKKA